MHHAFLLAAAALLFSAASGFAMPAEQDEGVYLVSRGPTGEEVHTFVKAASLRRDLPEMSAANVLSKRADWGHSHCGCGIKLNTGDTDAAVADLKSQLGKDGKVLRPMGAYYSIRGGVVAFVCNLDGNAPLKAWEDIVSQSTRAISDSCGNYIAGSTGGTTGFAIGYMDKSEGDFCGKALGAPGDHC